MLLCQTDFGELCDLKIAEILKLFLWRPVLNYFVGFVHIEGHVTILSLELLGKYPCWEMGGVPFQSVNPSSQRTLSMYKIHKVVFDGNVAKDNN